MPLLLVALPSNLADAQCALTSLPNSGQHPAVTGLVFLPQVGPDRESMFPVRISECSDQA